MDSFNEIIVNTSQKYELYIRSMKCVIIKKMVELIDGCLLLIFLKGKKQYRCSNLQNIVKINPS
jgi:hypothetical protein